MKFFSKAGCLALMGGLLLPSLGTATPDVSSKEDERPLLMEGQGFYRSCESLTGGIDGPVKVSSGTATVLRPIACKEPAEVHILPSDEVVLRSHAPLNITNIKFIVHSAALLRVIAPAIHIQRANKTDDAETSAGPVFVVLGRLELEATEEVPGYMEGTDLVDTHDIVTIGPEGTVHSRQTIGYTSNSIKVMGAAPKKEQTEHAKLPPSFAPAFSDLKAKLKGHIDPSAVDKKPSISPGDKAALFEQQPYFENGVVRSCKDLPRRAKFNGGILLLTGVIDCSGSGAKVVFIRGDATVRSDGDMLTNDVVWVAEDDADVTFDARTVTLSLTQGSLEKGFPVLSVKGAARFEVNGWLPSYSDGSPDTRNKLVTIGDGGVVDQPQNVRYTELAVMVADARAKPKNPDLLEAFRVQRAGLWSKAEQSSAEKAGFGSGRGSGKGFGSSSGGFRSSGSGFRADEPSHYLEGVLRVGEKLTSELLVSPDETCGLFVNPDDVSVMFLRVPDQTASDRQAMTPVVGTLIQSDRKAVERVKRIRRDVLREEARKSMPGAKEERPGVVRSVMGWLPYSENGWMTRRDRQRARDNWGESYVTLTKRGDLMGYMDGVRVLKKGGPSFFGWRKKSDRYEVRATNEGLEETRGDSRYVWGMKLRK